MRDFVSYPTAGNERLHCTMKRTEDNPEVGGPCYTLYLEYLGGLVPILKGRRISKLRPEFVIMDPKTDGKTGKTEIPPSFQPLQTKTKHQLTYYLLIVYHLNLTGAFRKHLGGPGSKIIESLFFIQSYSFKCTFSQIYPFVLLLPSIYRAAFFLFFSYYDFILKIFQLLRCWL